MADKFIGAPLGATHCAGGAYYRFDGSVWKFWNSVRNEWMRCADNKPEHTPIPLNTAPLGATHYADGVTNRTYYRFDGHVWKWWAASSREWLRCTDNKPASVVISLPPSEQSQCCGTTCNKRNVADYIARLEAVAEAARMVAYGVLANNITGDTLRRTLGELPHD